MNTNQKNEELWNNDHVQFARLISEIYMTQKLDMNQLLESMDLKESELDELFQRANNAWEKSKEEHCR